MTLVFQIGKGRNLPHASFGFALEQSKELKFEGSMWSRKMKMEMTEQPS